MVPNPPPEGQVGSRKSASRPMGLLRARQRRHGKSAAPVSIFAKDLANVEVFQVEKQAE